MQGDGAAARAAVFAALGDPVRLAMVDALAISDASPGELAQRFSLASNLTAHHLRVLETAGVVRRTVSEGDRRRSYVQLNRSDPLIHTLALTGTVTGFGSGRVVFVCTANSARSQLAAACWNRVSDRKATSAGTHPANQVHPGAVDIGRRHGLRLGRAATRSIADTLQPSDLVVAVCDNAHEELPAGLTRLHWSIPDPVRIDTAAAFEATYRDIVSRINDLAGTPAP